MSGLLRRLASRALGVAPTIRPVVEGSVESGFRESAEAPALGGARPSDDGRAPAAELPARMADAPAAPRVVANRAELAVPPADASLAPAAPQRPRPARHDVETPPAARAMVPIPPPLAIVPTANNEIDARPLAPIDRRPRPAAGETPPPLLPPQPGTPVLAVHPIAASLPTAPTVASRAAREEATEVHVTIGRIEVTAVHEAPQQQRGPARRGKPKSLDEYLAGRHGRRA